MSRAFRRIISVFLSILLFFSAFYNTKVEADSITGECGDSLFYSLDLSTGVLTIIGSGDMYNFDYDSGNSPTWEQYRHNINKVILENGVTSIGGDAFYWFNNLTAITIPDSITSIGGGAFWNCRSLATIAIPDSVTSIGSGAFVDCTSLETITIPEGVIDINNWCFLGCENLKTITIPDSVTNIGNRAFASCTSLETIAIPDSVTSIGSEAFAYCTSLETITIPSSVNSIGVDAFKNVNEIIAYCDNKVSINSTNNYGAKSVKIEHYAGNYYTNEPTCISTGANIKECGVCGQVYEEEIIPIDPENHAWGEPSYTWATDYSTVTATSICQNDSSHVLTETVNAVTNTIIASTCEEAGLNQYIGKFENELFEDQYELVDAPALGHDYKATEWVWNGYEGAFANFVCQHDSSHKRTETAVITSEVTVSPTCEKTGVKTYTASIVIDGITYTDVKEEVLQALGHDYQFGRFDWDEQYNAKAVYICSNDNNHELMYEAEVTSIITVPVTCESDGLKVYTASYDGHNGTKEEILPAIGHNYGEPTYEWEEDNSRVTARVICMNDPMHVVTENVKTTYSTTATCTESGITTFTAEFSNSLFRTQTKEDDTDPLGHDYYVNQWRWSTNYESVKAVLVCNRDKSHVEVHEGNITVERREPTCDSDGSIIYHATIVVNDKQFSDEQTVILPAFGHDYEEPTYTWSEDNSVVTARTVCKNDQQHILNESVHTIKEEIDPTCEENGAIKYSAQFVNEIFSQQNKEIVIPMLGHDFEYEKMIWASDNQSAQAYFVCKNDSSHTLLIDAEVTNSSDGQGVVFTAVAYRDGKEFKDIKTIHPTDGVAYAIWYNSRLIFFRSFETYYQDELRTCTDIYGNKLYGYVFTDVEKEKNEISSLYGRHIPIKEIYVYGGSIIRPVNMARWFQGLPELESFNAYGFDTSNVTDMSAMFNGCSSLTSLDLRYFDTSNVTDMSIMFGGCSSLTSLDISNFDTSNVIDMWYMFSVCSSLTSLDLSNFDTSHVSNMREMFCNCNSLKTINVAEFNTSKVTNMRLMFGGCGSLTSLDLSNFDTSNVTDMSSMFGGCNSLNSLDLSSFNTSNVYDMKSMFVACRSLTSLDLSSFDTSGVSDMSSMFIQCSSLTELNLGNFDTHKVANMSNMFNSCSALEKLDLSNFNTNYISSMDQMFQSCSSLESIKLGKQFTKWINNAYLPEGTWAKDDITKTEIELYQQYPHHAEEWAGTWTIGSDISDKTVRLLSRSVNFEGILSMNFYIQIPEGMEGAYVLMEYSKAGVEPKKVMLDNTIYQADKDRYRVTFDNIPAKEMMETVSISVYDSEDNKLPFEQKSGEEYVAIENDRYSYRVYDYGKALAEHSNEKYAYLGKALLNYGQRTQEILGYKTDELMPNHEGYLADKVVEVNPGYTENFKKGDGSFTSKSLNFEGATSIFLYFLEPVSASSADTEMLSNEKVVVNKQPDGRYRVEVLMIPAKKLHEMYKLNIVHNGTTYDFEVSALSYANSLMGVSNEKYINMGKALYIYNDAARNYFGN